MKQNSTFEIICVSIALAGLVMKTVVNDLLLKQVGGLILYGLTTIAVLSKTLRFQKLPAKKYQRLPLYAGILLMLAACIGELVDRNGLYNILWLLGILVSGIVNTQIYKANQPQPIA
jgi:dipeptide/tripeptide permease